MASPLDEVALEGARQVTARWLFYGLFEKEVEDGRLLFATAGKNRPATGPTGQHHILLRGYGGGSPGHCHHRAGQGKMGGVHAPEQPLPAGARAPAPGADPSIRGGVQGNMPGGAEMFTRFRGDLARGVRSPRGPSGPKRLSLSFRRPAVHRRPDRADFR